jgi:hypothetical protein
MTGQFVITEENPKIAQVFPVLKSREADNSLSLKPEGDICPCYGIYSGHPMLIIPHNCPIGRKTAAFRRKIHSCIAFTSTFAASN